MNGFDQELREIAAGLELPEPARSTILLELKGDLEDLSASLQASGIPEEEARSRAVATLLPDTDSLEALRSLHRPWWERLVERYSEPARNRLERLLLAVLVGVLLLGGGGTLARLDLMASPSGFLWPVLALGASGLALGVYKLLDLFVKQDHRPSRLGRGMFALPVVSAASVVLAFTGVVFDLYATAGRIEQDAAAATLHLLEWIRRDAVLLSVALMVAALAAVAWFLASVRIARIARAEAEVFRTPSAVVTTGPHDGRER
ncbi:MAG: hypothetical protein PVI57_10650 [Gemmatimonadota bacterium]